MKARKNKYPIDFVILWVDGNDPEWIKDRKKYQSGVQEDNREFKFRDWDNLQYLFRGIEKFTPWVRNVYLVTWGHVPKWINLGNPKLHIVKHNEFMDSDCVPCFNSEAIESCIFRIKGLSENFVYFNDDQFILQPMKKSDFFIGDTPCDAAILNVHCCDIVGSGTLSQFLSVGIINRNFNMKKVIKKHFLKWINLKYGKNMLRTIFLFLVCPRFPGFYVEHLPGAYNKSTFRDVWNNEYDLLNMTAHHRFRNLAGISQWIFKEWQLCTGNFVPRKCNMGKSLAVTQIEQACKIIRLQKYKMICFNDGDISDKQYDKVKKKLNSSFELILPEKCSFEK